MIFVGGEEFGGVEVTLVASDPSPWPFEVIVVPMESTDLSAEGTNEQHTKIYLSVYGV